VRLARTAAVAWLLGIVAGLGACARGCGGPGSRAGAGATVVTCGPAGCPADERKPAPGGVLRVHVEAEPAGLCDLVNHEAWVRWIVENQVMDTLLEQSPRTGAIGPRLAERWELAGTGASRTLTFHLRDGVRFHDGHPLGASDVAFTLERARDPKLGADQKSDLDPVGRISAPDERTLVLALPGPAPFLLQALAHLAIYPRHLLEGVDLRTAPFCRAPIGSGPFRVAAWRSGVSITLERAPTFWGPPAPLDRVELVVVRDRQAAWLLYQRGELDLMTRLPAGAAAAAERDPRLAGHRLYRHTPRAFFFVLWNTRRPELAAPATRAALGHLVDLPRFIEVAFEGHARPQSGPFVAGTPAYDEGIAPLAYEPDAARAALALASPRPRALTFLATAGSASVEQLATLLEEDLRKAGVTLTIEKLDFSRVLDRLRKHDFDVTALQLTLALEQDNWGLFHSRAIGEQNWGGFADPEVDALLDRIRTTDDADARHALDRAVHRALHEHGPMSFLVAPEVDTALAAGFGGVTPSSDGLGLAHVFRVDGAP